jgi:hypothetical protein
MPRTQTVEPRGRRCFVCDNKACNGTDAPRVRVFLPQGVTEVPSCPNGHGPMRREANSPKSGR